MDSQLKDIATVAAFVGAGIIVGISGIYLLHQTNKNVESRLAHISSSVEQLRKDISELKSLQKRKSGIGSSFSDETDVYYDFSDDGEDEISLNISRKSSDSLLYVDQLIDNLSSNPHCPDIAFNQILNLKDELCGNYEYLWRLAKTCHIYGTIAGNNKDLQKKKEMLFEGRKYATAALALTDDCADVHKWYAICVGSCTEFESNADKIKDGFTFRKHIKIAMEIAPNDESLYHLLGRWCYEVAMLPWMQRQIASTWFGEIPTSTLQEARDYFMKCENLRKTGVWKENRLFVAKTYIGEKDYANAAMWLDKASEGPTFENADQLVMSEILELQKKYSSYRK